MKTTTLKPHFILRTSLSLVLFFSAELGFSQTDVFKKQMAVKNQKLGLQCAFENLNQARAHTDPLVANLSDSQFDLEISALGFQLSDLERAYATKDVETAALCFMSRKEISALVMYSMSTYRKMNAALRGNDQAKLADYKTYRLVLDSALDKLKDYKGYVKRGATTDLTRYEDHQMGATVSYPAYTSTSVGSGFVGHIRSLILSKTCKYIAPISMVPQEEEVLCKPGVNFKVIYRKDLKTVTHLMLEEVD